MADVKGTATVSLNGKEAGLELERLEQKARDLRTAIIEVRKAEILDTKKLKNLQSELNVTNSTIKQTKRSMYDYKVVLDNLSGASIKELTQSYAALNREVSKLPQNSKEYADGIQNLAKIKSNIDGHHTSIKNLGNELGKTGVKAESFGMKLTNSFNQFAGVAVGAIAAITGIVMGFRKLSDIIVTFEKSFTNVLTSLSEADIEKYGKILEQGSIDMIKNYGFAIEDANKSMFDTVSAGIAAGDAIGVVNESSVLAVGGVSQLSVATDGITSVLNAWGVAATDVNKVSSSFFAAQKAGKTTVQELAFNIGRIAPIASSLGISYQEVMAAQAQMTLSGINTAESTTMLKSAFSSLMKPTGDAAKILKEYGVPIGASEIKAKGFTYTLERLNDMIKQNPDDVAKAINSVEGLTGIMSLSGKGLEKFKDILNNVNNDYGEGSSLVKAYEKQTGTSAFAIDKAKGQLTALVLTLKDDLSPIIKSVMEAFSNFSNVTVKFSANNKQIVEFIAEMFKNSGALTDIYKSIFQEVGTLFSSMSKLAKILFNIKSAGNAAAGVISVLKITLTAATLPLRAIVFVLTKLYDGLNIIVPVIKSWYGFMAKVGKSIFAVASEIGKLITKTPPIRALINTFIFLKDVITDIPKIFTKIINYVKELSIVKVIVNGIILPFKLLKDAITAIPKLFTSIINYAKEFKILTITIEFVTNVFKTFVNTIYRILDALGVIAVVKESFISLKNTIKTIFSEEEELAARSVANAAKNALEKVEINKTAADTMLDIAKTNSTELEKIQAKELAAQLEKNKELSEERKKKYEELVKNNKAIKDLIDNLNIQLIEDEKKKAVEEIKLWRKNELEKIKISGASAKLRKEAAELTDKLYIEKLKDLDEKYINDHKQKYQSIIDFQKSVYDAVIKTVDEQNAYEIKKIEEKYQTQIDLANQQAALGHELSAQFAQKAIELEKQKTDEVNAYKLKAEADFAKKVLEEREKYGLLSNEEQFLKELTELQNSYQQKLLSEEQYLRALYGLREKYESQYKGFGGESPFIKREEELASLQEQFDNGLILEEEYNGRKLEANVAAAEEAFNQLNAVNAAAANYVSTLKQQDVAETELDEQKKLTAIKKAKDEELKAAGNNAAQREIIISKYAEREKQVKQETEEQKKQIMKRYADAEFAVKVSQIIADTAVAIIKAIAQLGPIAGPIAAGLIGATSLIQIGIANKERQQVAGLAEGGGTEQVQRIQDNKIFNAGKTSKRGLISKPSILVGEDGAEYVIPNAGLQNPNLMSVVSHIEASRLRGDIKTFNFKKAIAATTPARGFADGGATATAAVNTAVTNESDKTNQLLIELINAVNNLSLDIKTWKTQIKSYVVYEDITDAGDRLNEIKTDTQM